MIPRRGHHEAGLSTLVLVAIVVVVLAGGTGIAYVATDGFGRNADEPAAAGPPDKTGGSHETADENADEDAESMIKDAFAGKAIIACEYSDGGQDATAYIKSDTTFRVDAANDMHMLKIDATAYLWGAQMPQGIKFDGTTYNEQLDADVPSFTPEDFESAARNDVVTCREYDGDDIVFEVPDDVTFMDMSGAAGS